MNATTRKSGWIVLATLLRPQGRKGEILAESLTDFPETLAGRAGTFLAPEGFGGDEPAAQACRITDVWMPKGKNEGRIVLAIDTVDSIDKAEKLAGLELIVRPEHRHALEQDALYISDLVGNTLFDNGVVVGTVRDLHFATSPDGRRRLEDAAPLLVVDAGTDEVLIPFVREHIVRVDDAAHEIHMQLPSGLVDLQRGPAVNIELRADEKDEASRPETGR